jgi:hypothetical protein
MKSGHMPRPGRERYLALFAVCGVAFTVGLVVSGNAAFAILIAVAAGGFIAEPLFRFRAPDEPPRRPG